MSPINKDEDFFAGKRPWSIIKDKVIRDYMPVYLAKVARLPNKIILVDAFAGPGVFGDTITDETSEGSPIIICNTAEQYASDKYTAFFGNIKDEYHQRLTKNLEEHGSLVSKGKAVPVLGDNSILLAKVQKNLRSETILVYLDPFGVTGCDFETIIKPFLMRDKRYSTEIIFNMSVPILYRLAASKAVKKGEAKPKVVSYHQRLDKMLGGDWWREILLDDSIAPEDQALRVVRRYTEQLKMYLPFAGFCPVQEREGARLKYFITFCSRHLDAMLALNDIMCRAYNEYIVPATYGIGLFKDLTWQDNRPVQLLESKIIEKVQVLDNPPRSRRYIWEQIVQENFMFFTSSEYNKAVTKLVSERRLDFVDLKKTKKINDDSLLIMPKQPLELQQKLW